MLAQGHRRLVLCRCNLIASAHYGAQKRFNSSTPTLTTPKEGPEATDKPVRSFNEIVKDMNVRKNNYLTTISTNDACTQDWEVAIASSGKTTDQQTYFSPLQEGDLVTTSTGNVALILQVPDHITTYSCSILDHQGSVSTANASSFAFRIPKFCTPPISLASTIRVLDDSDPAHPVLSVTKNTRKFLCPRIKKLLDLSQVISEQVGNELENIFLELQDSAEPVNVSLFEVAWYVEQALIERSKQKSFYLARTLKVAPKERYSSLKGIFPPLSEENSKKIVTNEVFLAVFNAIKAKFSTKVLFDKNEYVTPSILTLVPFSVENEHNRAVERLRLATMGQAVPLIKKITDILEGRSKAKPAEFLQDKSDQELFHLIERYAVGDLSSMDHTSNSLVAMFLRKFSKYKNADIDPSVAFKFLQEVFYFGKWNNPVRSQSKLRPLEAMNETSAVEKAPYGIPDSLQSIREEFNEPVYCIDDPGAHEIDDGISVTNTKDRVWKVYIHIADPASGLTLEDPLMQHAYRQTSTAYYPENVIPLFPKWFSHSLGLVQSEDGRRCLTFEIDYDSQNGTFDIENMRVSPRMASKIVQLTYDEVDKILIDKKHKSGRILEDVQNLYQVAVDFSKLRFQSGAFGLSFVTPVAKLHNFSGTGATSSNQQKPIELEISMSKKTTSRDMVAEFMILCNHATAVYTKTREIASIYRTQSLDFASTAAKQRFDTIASRQQQVEFGSGIGKSLSVKDSLIVLKSLRSAGLSVDPQPHVALGLDVYSHNTSPLRRFQDVLSHWQIEKFLLKDNKSMFDSSQMDTMSVRLMRNQGLLKRASRQSNTFWTLQKIEEIVQINKSDPNAEPLKFDCIITSQAGFDRVQNVYCSNWGILGSLIVKEGSSPFQIGDSVTCTLNYINSHRQAFVLVPSN